MENECVPVTVIIPTYNRFLSLQRTVSVLLNQKTIPSQLVIVDQTQDEQMRLLTQSFLQECYAVTKIDYIYQNIPSLTNARNKGVLYAINDEIVFMDDDVDVSSDTIENIHLLFENEEISMIGAIDETLPSGKGMLGILFGMKSFRYRNQGYVTKAMLGRYPDNLSGIVPTMWAMGFCFALKKSLVQKWGLQFDEKLTGYAFSEDLDFTFSYYKKATEEGLRCILSDSVHVNHLESKEYRIPQKKNTYKYVINRQYLCYKHKMGLFSRLMCRWANFGMFIFRFISKASPWDVLKAQIRCDCLNSYLKKGIIEEYFSD